METKMILDLNTNETGVFYWLPTSDLPAKIVKELERAGYSSYIEYLYSDNGQLIFVYERINLKQSEDLQERRFYFSGDNLIRFIKTINGKADVFDTGLETYLPEAAPIRSDAEKLASFLSSSLSPMLSDISRSEQGVQASLSIYPPIVKRRLYTMEEISKMDNESDYMTALNDLEMHNSGMIDDTEQHEIRIRISTGSNNWEIDVGSFYGWVSQHTRSTGSGMVIEGTAPGGGDNYYLEHKAGRITAKMELWGEGSGSIYTYPLFDMVLPNGISAAVSQDSALTESRLIKPPGTFKNNEGPEFSARVAAGQMEESSSWTAKIGSINQPPSVSSDGTIYAATNEGMLYSISPNGNIKWSVNLEKEARITPVVGPGADVYIITENGVMHAFSAAGEERWTFPGIDNDFGGPAIGSEGVLYTVSGNDELIAISRDGSELWRVPQGDSHLFSPVVDKDGMILVADSHASLLMFTPDGKLKYKGNTHLPATYSRSFSFKRGDLSISDDGKIYFSGYGMVSMFDIKNWTESRPSRSSVWAEGVGNKNLSEVIIGGDGRVYAAFLLAPYEIDFRLSVFHDPGGWSYKDIMGRIVGSPILASDGNIYFCTDDGDLISVTPGGKVLSTEKVADSITTRPVPGSEGNLYIGTPDGLKSIDKEVAISADDPWPVPRQNSRNSACCGYR